METSAAEITLSQLPIGARLIYRSKKEWRFAVLSRLSEEKATMIVCSPTGRSYRLRRELDTQIYFDGPIPVLKSFEDEDWRENFSTYDCRW